LASQASPCSACSRRKVTFDIPDNPEWVTQLSGKLVRYWELLVETRRRGVDFRTTFPLQVYARR